MHLLAHSDPAGGFPGLDLLPALASLIAASACRRLRDRILLLLAATGLAAAALPPLHDLAEASVTGHMVQHLVLIVVVAPLLGVVLATAPSRLRGRSVTRALARAVTHPLAPIVSGVVHAAALVAWHVPALYDAAVESWIAHGLEHLVLTATGAWWWASVVHHAARRAVPTAVISLFVVATTGAAMGVFMMFAPAALYHQGGVGDQQIAGAVMAGGTGAVYAGTALWLVARAVERLTDPMPVRIPASSRGAAMIGPVAVCALAALGGLFLQSSDDADGGRDELGRNEIGRELYRRDCASCHGPDARGSFRGTPLDEAGTASVRYMVATGRMPIGSPDAEVRRSEPIYDEVEIDAIVGYLDALIEGPTARPEPDIHARLEDPDLPRGGERYRLHCAACHGAEGIGGALAVQGVAPSVLHAEATDVVDAMTAGPGAMPAFDRALDDAEMVDVAAYVQMLQDPPGTAPIALPGGRIGEGLVAWVAGLGVLLVAARWLGTRQ